MADLLEGVRAKLDRGTKHLRELDRKVRGFFASNPYRVIEEPDDDPRYAGWYLGRFHIDRMPPIELGVVAGETLFQYRSALDHLMTRVLALEGNAQGNFPIYPDGRFWKASRRRDRSPADTLKPLIRPEHFALIERLQMRENHKPRRGILSTRQALTLIKWFTNLDKHELVRAAFFSTRRMRVGDHPRIAEFQVLMTPIEDLHAGTKLYRVRFVSEEKVKVPFRVEPDLTFGEAPYAWITVNTIRICAKRTRQIVQRFVEVTPEFRSGGDPNPN